MSRKTPGPHPNGNQIAHRQQPQVFQQSSIFKHCVANGNRNYKP
jgi:hypothetical protein